ncbi:hypothetical protein [Priestia aryabhattai]|uniref:hypothetical protein n=1 Tax=Priestia aryabhattai TaxID=412384 RepID=UPI0015F363C7|nr:hypothetical protein [Priestia aryabhattai]
MGIFGLDKVKMFFKGKDGDVQEMSGEVTEVTYEPVENEYKDLDFSDREYEVTSEGIMFDNADFDNMISSLNEIIKNNKRDQKILNRTKNKRIAKKVYKRLYNL